MEQYHDRLLITTPEGLQLDLALAGLGSRFCATLIDVALKAALVLGTDLALLWLGAAGLALIAIASFLVYFGYDIAFELLAAGRTPGKRATGLRVMRASGSPVDLQASALRSIMRLVDGLPMLYVPGVVSILVTRRNQRLGDLAAGTVVVRERHGGRGRPAPVASPRFEPLARAVDVSAITDDEIAAVRSFLERRGGFEPRARASVADRLAEALRPRVVGDFDGSSPETFLEELVRAKLRS